MKTLKIVVLVALALLASCGTLVAVVFSLTSGMTDAADQFFVAVRQQDLPRARNLLAEEFRASTTDDELRAFLAGSALVRFKEASWSSRQMTNGRGELEGTVTTDTGGSIPVRLTLVKEHGAWKILSLRRPSAGVRDDDDAPAELPARRPHSQRGPAAVTPETL